MEQDEEWKPIGESMERTMSGLGAFNREREPLEDEYKVGDIVYCKKCKTPRQERIADNCIVNIMCDCEYAEVEKQKEMDRLKKIEDMRRKYITTDTFRKYRFNADDGLSPRNTEICRKYVDSFRDKFKKTGYGLLLYGSVGTGKTFLAMCVANALIEQGYVVRNTSLSEISRRAQDFDSRDNYFAQLYKSDVIVLDDLGTERNTEFSLEQSSSFIDTCYVFNIPLIITTNLPPTYMDKVSNNTEQPLYKRRIFSRILERNYPIFVNDVKHRSIKANLVHEDMKKIIDI